jgi:hypothetical protein
MKMDNQWMILYKTVFFVWIGNPRLQLPQNFNIGPTPDSKFFLQKLES